MMESMSTIIIDKYGREEEDPQEKEERERMLDLGLTLKEQKQIIYAEPGRRKQLFKLFTERMEMNTADEELAPVTKRGGSLQGNELVVVEEQKDDVLQMLEELEEQWLPTADKKMEFAHPPERDRPPQ